jgi:hypothetical protein
MSVSLSHFSVRVGPEVILFIVIIIPVVIPTIIFIHIVIPIVFIIYCCYSPQWALSPRAFAPLGLPHFGALSLGLTPLSFYPFGLTFGGLKPLCLYHLKLDHPGLRKTKTAPQKASPPTGLGHFWGLHHLGTFR